MEISEVTKSFGKLKALDSVSISNISGVHCLVGENGAGKTTLLRILATVLEKDSGNISHNDLLWDNVKEVKKNIGYLPQNFGMYRTLSVREALEHIAILKRVKGDIKESVTKVIKQVNLEEKTDEKVGTLSGGMVRRLGIAQALLGDPEILIVDEPTSGLDPEERMRFRLLLRELGNQRTVLFSTHIVDDAETVCDRMTVLHKGRVIMTGTCEEIRQAASGRIWEVMTINDRSSESIRDSYVTARKAMGNSCMLRMISEKNPGNGAVQAEPTLEEGYLYLIRRKDTTGK